MAKRSEDTISIDSMQAPHQLNGFNSTPNSTPPLTKAENRIFLLSNDKRRGTVSLDVEEDTIDPDSCKIDPLTGEKDWSTGRVRRMRLLRGAQTIWFDEQPPNVFPQNYVNKNIMTLDFDGGRMVVPIREPLKAKAAELTMRNITNRKRFGTAAKPKDIYFYEWNPVEQDKKALEDQNNIIKAMQLAATVPLKEIIPHARYLNIQFQDEQGVELNEQSLRMAYSRAAMTDATKFLNSIHSPVVKTSFMVRTGIDKGLIDLGKQPGAAYWTDGGFISALPEGRDAIEYLIEFAMTYGDANALFANQLRELTS